MDVKKISRQSWRVSLKIQNQKLSQNGQLPRVAILGVGNELNGDDGAGLQVIRSLKQSGLPPDRFLLLETGSAPENFTAPISRFSPDWVLAIDAARLGYLPGRIAWIHLQEIEGASAATHGLPLSMVGKYLVAETHCAFDVIGIQVLQTEFDCPVSHPVQRAITRVSSCLRDLFHRS